MHEKSISFLNPANEESLHFTEERGDLIRKMNSSLPSNGNSIGCHPHDLSEATLQQSPFIRVCLMLIAVVNILSCPFTVVLNALVMIAVKWKSRLRCHKSNILLATLASTDFMVGLLLQPVFVAELITLLLDKAFGKVCLLSHISRVGISYSSFTSFLHLALLSGERFLALKRPFAHMDLVTTSRLLCASALAWLLPVILHIRLPFGKTVILSTNVFLMVITMIFIIFCHVTVFRETRRHEQRLAAQQVTQEAREKFEKEKKAVKITFIILTVFVLCCLPFVALRVVLQLTRGTKKPTETVKIVGQLSRSLLLLNSLLNPIIYSVRIKQFRVSFKELLGGTGNVETPEDLGVFRRPNAADSCRAGRNPGERNRTERNENKTGSDIVPQRRNFCV